MIRTNLIEDLTLIPLPPWWQTVRGLALLALALVLVALAGWWMARRRSRSGVGLPSAVPEPDRTGDFLARLEALRGRRDQVSPHDFALECSDVLREYVEWRHRLAIRFQTTREFLDAAARSSALAEDQRAVLGDYLRSCDLLKFARQDATPEEEGRLVETALDLVRKGAPR